MSHIGSRRAGTGAITRYKCVYDRRVNSGSDAAEVITESVAVSMHTHACLVRYKPPVIAIHKVTPVC